MCPTGSFLPKERDRPRSICARGIEKTALSRSRGLRRDSRRFGVPRGTDGASSQPVDDVRVPKPLRRLRAGRVAEEVEPVGCPCSSPLEERLGHARATEARGGTRERLNRQQITANRDGQVGLEPATSPV